MLFVPRTNVIIWHIDIYSDSDVYRVVLGVVIEEDFPLVYHIVTDSISSETQKFIFKFEICCVQTLPTSFITKAVTKCQYFHTGGTALT